MIHLTLNQISAFIDAELPEASVELVRLHLSSCLECTERFGLIEEQEEALARLLVNDPGEAYFTAFTERVLGPAPAPAPAPAVKKEAAAKAQVAKKEVAAPTPVAKKEVPAPAPVAKKEAPAVAAAARPPKKSRGAARILIPAAALLLVASAAAVIVTRPDLAGLPARGADTPSARSPEREGDAAAGLRAPPSADEAPGAAAPTDLLERAAANSAEADRGGTAEAHDAAARAWEEALPALESNPDELAAGRREIASARYRAWTEEGTPERREAATRAVRAYLLCAPAGSERDSAWTWLARLKR